MYQQLGFWPTAEKGKEGGILGFLKTLKTLTLRNLKLA